MNSPNPTPALIHSQWAPDLDAEQRQDYDPNPVGDWFTDLDDEDDGVERWARA